MFDNTFLVQWHVFSKIRLSLQKFANKPTRLCFNSVGFIIIKPTELKHSLVGLLANFSNDFCNVGYSHKKSRIDKKMEKTSKIFSVLARSRLSFEDKT